MRPLRRSKMTEFIFCRPRGVIILLLLLIMNRHQVVFVDTITPDVNVTSGITNDTNRSTYMPMSTGKTSSLEILDDRRVYMLTTEQPYRCDTNQTGKECLSGTTDQYLKGTNEEGSTNFLREMVSPPRGATTVTHRGNEMETGSPQFLKTLYKTSLMPLSTALKTGSTFVVQSVTTMSPYATSGFVDNQMPPTLPPSIPPCPPMGFPTPSAPSWPLFPPCQSAITNNLAGSNIIIDDSWNNMDPMNSSENALSLLFNITAPLCEETLCFWGTETKNCYCDDFCYFYRDCCYTMIRKLGQNLKETTELENLIAEKAKQVENTTLMFRKDLVRCITDENGMNGVLMISDCAREIKADDSYKEECIKGDSYSYKNVPVDRLDGYEPTTTFKNIHCALCNGVSERELEFWRLQIQCNSTENVDITTDTTLEDISRYPGCVLVPFSLREMSTRHCHTEVALFQGCAERDTGEETLSRPLCESYLYPLAEKVANETVKPQVVYRNPHCASCVKKESNISDLTCVTLGGVFRNDQIVFSPVNLQVLFDFHPARGFVHTIQCKQGAVCDDDEIYDCVLNTCKQLYCPPGMRPLHGECVPDVTAVGGLTIVKTWLPKDFSAITGRDEKIIFELSFAGSFVNETDVETFENVISDLFYYFFGVLDKTVKITAEIEGCYCLVIQTDSFHSALKILEDVYKSPRIQARMSEAQLQLPDADIKVTLRNYQSLKLLECANGELLVANDAIVDGLDGNTYVSFNVTSLQLEIPEHEGKWQLSYKMDKPQVQIFATCLFRHETPSLPLICPMVSYNIEDVLFYNESILVMEDDVVLHEKDFMISGSQVYVCLNALRRYQWFINVFQYADVHNLMSIVTSSVSVSSATVIITVHICVKQLRNIHGLNITALSVVILLIHVLLLGQSSIESRLVCTAYAITLHFLLICMFVWTSVIGFDMTRIFASNMIVPRINPVKRFLTYSCVSALVPFILLIVCGSLEFTTSSYRPEYGKYKVCWLSNGRAIVAFVIIPVSASMILNIVSFVYTARNIRQNAKDTKMIRESVHRAYIFVYLKLSAILGFTWIFGIVAGLVDEEWFWIVHIILNGLQGLSLLTCSFVNARVLRKFRSSLKFSSTVTEGNSTANSRV